MPARKEKVLFFEKCLLDFFKKAGREHLPWRPRKISQTGSRGKAPEITAYEIWVSEIMLQQTQVSRVIGYYTKFLKRFPNVQSLAQASWQEFLPYYEGLGYYSRGRNILKAAKIIVAQHQGKLPRDAEALRRLPGIGPYTAAAIMSFAYGDELLAWDTNLKRVIGRFFFGNKHAVGDTSAWERVFKTPKKTLNAALMDFGSALCVARPKCEACSLKTQCMYFKTQGIGESSARSKIKNLKSKIGWNEAEVYVFLHENHKRYFSSNTKTFKPFILPPAYNARAGIKKYFQEQYALLLSVRPPHKKILIKGKPVLLVHAQILLGQSQFPVFPRSSVTRYTMTGHLRDKK